MQQDIEPRMRTMRTIWSAMLMSIGFYYAFTFFAKRPENVEPNSTLFLVLVGIAVSTVLLSFPVKNKLISQAIEQQHVPLVQQSYIVAWGPTQVTGRQGPPDF
jgi:multisubunit Na+/H+ antiporter MnhG subunit